MGRNWPYRVIVDNPDLIQPAFLIGDRRTWDDLTLIEWRRSTCEKINFCACLPHFLPLPLFNPTIYTNPHDWPCMFAIHIRYITIPLSSGYRIEQFPHWEIMRYSVRVTLINPVKLLWHVLYFLLEIKSEGDVTKSWDHRSIMTT